MKDENTYIRFDWAMKHVLRDKANFGILEGLISVLLNQDIKIVEILESESNQDDIDDKFNRVDIKAKNSKGHIILVEVQLTTQSYYLQRILYGVCKTITEHINIGNKYDQVKKVYSISILYCEFGEGDDYVYRGETAFEGIHTGSKLIVNTREDGVIVQHLPREVFPEYYLIRVNKFDKIPANYLDEWMEYLKTGKVRDNTTAPGLQQVKEKLQLLSMSKAERRAYDIHMDNVMQQNDMYDTAINKGREEGREEGIKEGIKKGIKEGIKEGRKNMLKDIVANMLSKGMPIETISLATGLSETEITEMSM